MGEYQLWTDRQTVYVVLLLAALVLLWDLLPSTRPWMTPSTLALVCVPLWLYVLHAEPHSSARRAYAPSPAAPPSSPSPPPSSSTFRAR